MHRSIHTTVSNFLAMELKFYCSSLLDHLLLSAKTSPNQELEQGTADTTLKEEQVHMRDCIELTPNIAGIYPSSITQSNEKYIYVHNFPIETLFQALSVLRL